MSVRAGLTLSIAAETNKLPPATAAARTNTKNVERPFIANDLARRARNFNANQPGRSRASHQRLGPTVWWIKVLFVTPDHFQFRAVRFLPNYPLIDISLPPRRVAGHEINFEKVWPRNRTVFGRECREIKGRT